MQSKMDLKFRDSSMKKRCPEREETSQKKYGFKYYDYCDMVPNRHRVAQSAIVHAPVQGSRAGYLHKSLYFSRPTKRSTNQSQITTLIPSKQKNKPKQYSVSEQLRYYKVICKNLRKENIQLKSEHEELLRRKKPKSKASSNKENVDSSKYTNLMKQLSNIESQIDQPAISPKQEKYRDFYVGFVKSLRRLGMKEPKGQKEALKRWRGIVQQLLDQGIDV